MMETLAGMEDASFSRRGLQFVFDIPATATET